MGISFSKSNNTNSTHNSTNNSTNNSTPSTDQLLEKLDDIACHYIMTMDFQSLRNLYLPEYCEKITILTADIIDRYFTTLELDAFNTRIEPDNNEKLMFSVTNGTIPVPNIEKKRVICRKIATFYIKIAHVFAAIVTTINPEYVYTDIFGNTIKNNLYQKSKIPKGKSISINKINLCENRIQALEELGEGIPPAHPQLCSINLNSTGSTEKTLHDEIGIPELMELYYDDVYDYKTGKFKDMSPKTRVQFNEDLRMFYSTFTGIEEMPENIKGFNQIKLRDYNKTSVICSDSVPQTASQPATSLYPDLFIEYAKNLKDMLFHTNETHRKLLNIIDKLFMVGEIKIRIHPNLNDKRLQEIIDETRNLIVSSYLSCETDFTRGIELYEAIVEKMILQTSQSQLSALENSMVQLYEQ